MVTRLLKASSKVSVRAHGRHVPAGLTGNGATAETLMEIYGDALCAAGEVHAGRRGSPPGERRASPADSRTPIHLLPETPGLGLSADPGGCTFEAMTDTSGNSCRRVLGSTSPGEHFCLFVDVFLAAAPACCG